MTHHPNTNISQLHLSVVNDLIKQGCEDLLCQLASPHGQTVDLQIRLCECVHMEILAVLKPLHSTTLVPPTLCVPVYPVHV